MRALNPVDLGPAIAFRDGWREFDRFLKMMWQVTVHRPEARKLIWALLLETLLRKPRAVRTFMVQVAFYLYLPGIVSYVVGQMRTNLAEIESGTWKPVLVPRPAEATPELVQAAE